MTDHMKKICILGSTGSIGISTLDVIHQHPDHFKATILATHTNTNLLAEQVQAFKPRQVVIYDQFAFEKFRREFAATKLRILYGNDGLIAALTDEAPDIFVNAFVGFAGLKPTIEALHLKIPVALANKETLVVAGAYVKKLAAKNGVPLIPIDSEHSAIWQCLAGEAGNRIRRLILTASGGPFRTKSLKYFSAITAQQALKHPNWKMGAKITIDSATLMNKGLEVIEAFWLYNVPLECIEVVIHPQSIIHSMVEFEDMSIKAQLGTPDMRIPIQYAISHPQRLPLGLPAMDFFTENSLTFEKPDLKKFPCLHLAYHALNAGSSFPAVLNAANEIAVAAFLSNKIKFTDIPELIEDQLNAHKPSDKDDFDTLWQIDQSVRKKSEAYVRRHGRKQ
jgi:1-deoxy-D-xylulose-5-phosphate reductoisomerase